MNPGLLEEVSKTTNSLVDAFRSTPLTLALVVFNIALLVFMFWYSSNVLEQRARTTDLMVGLIKDTNKALSTCVSDDVMAKLIDAVRQGREAQR